MKRFLLFAAFAVITVSSFAQEKSVIGKWKVLTLSSAGSFFNIEDPAQVKAELKKQFEASGSPVDTAMVEMIFKSVYDALASMTFDFQAGGKLILNSSADGKPKHEEENYTIDYAKGLIVSKSEEKEQNIFFKFDKEKLVLSFEDTPGKLTVITLKKIQ